MKKILALLLATMMVLGSVSAFAEAPAAEKGTIIYGSTTELSGDWGREFWTNNAVDRTVREMMDDYYTVVSNQGGEWVINETIAKSIESVINEDGTKTFTVQINKGLVYNNGDAITAKDYVAGFLFPISKVGADAGMTLSTTYLTYVGGEAYHDGSANILTGIRLIDDYTFSVSIVADKIPYYYDITYARMFPLHVKSWFGEGIEVVDDGEGAYFSGDYTIEALGEKIEAARFASDNRVSAGPYTLVSFDKSALQATLVINENYVGNFEDQKPTIKKIVIVKAEDETWADAIKTGAFNFYDTITDGSTINDALDIIDAGGFGYVQFDRAGYGKLMFQCDFGPTQFIAVRHAIAMLLDRNEFANTFCAGWGGIVNGPYGTGLWQFKESEEWLDENLNTYAYNADGAVALLVEDGWVLNAEGGEYTEGIRYKEVTAEEAGTYAHNVTLADGKILMPLIIEWSSSEGNSVSELLKVMLAENPDTAAAGIQINQNVMTFSELLNFMYRDASQGDKYGVPTYGMYNLATGFVPSYDYAYDFSIDPEMVAQGKNVNYLFDEKLDQLSMDMVFGVETGDNETYLGIWQQFVQRWNEQLPEVPLYSNVYISMYPDWLEGYTQDSFWDFQQAILYATVAE